MTRNQMLLAMIVGLSQGFVKIVVTLAKLGWVAASAVVSAVLTAKLPARTPPPAPGPTRPPSNSTAPDAEQLG